MAGLGTASHGAGVWRHMLEGERLPGRENDGVVPEEGEIVGQLFGLLLTGNHHQHRSSRPGR